MNPVFIVGCGDIGRRIAAIMQQSSRRISALARTTDSARRLSELEIEPVMGDLDRPKSLHKLALAGSEIFYLAPPPGRGNHDPRMAHLLAALETSHPPARIVYISTSGVYGNRGGQWVDENTVPNPETERARRRLDAETQLRQWGQLHGVAVVILRVGGIYADGRLPVERLRRGDPVLREEECGYTNRIHADDLTQACIAAMQRGEPDAIYNASDGQPGTMTGYFFAVADHLGLPRPPTISLNEARQRLTPAMLSYLLESRRLDNRKLIQGLGMTLRYPDLESGLAASAHKQ